MKNLSQVLLHLLRRSPNLDRSYLSVVRDHCLVCEEAISESPLYLRLRLCPHCRFHYSLTARERIELLVDRGSFREINRSIASLFPLSFSSRSSYPRRLSQDQTRTGLTEAVVTGHCAIAGNKAMVVVLDFGFMGGSMGTVVGEKVALAFESAAKSQHPLVAVVSGGGIRTQEGVLSLLQMAKTVTAANLLREGRVPFIVVLSNPATGQVYASFANLADVILAEPGSLIGLASMRTLREASKHPVPLDAHTAEAHLSHGLLDRIVDREDLLGELSTLLEIMGPQRSPRNGNGQAQEEPNGAAGELVETGRILEIARDYNRPTALHYINAMVDKFIELKGDRVSGDDETIVGGLGYLMGEKVVIIGQQRIRSIPVDGYHTYPEGFRKARRLIALAARFKLPVITLVDTQGAHPGLESEEQGVGNAIATILSLMAEAPTPIISVIIGEGGSEGALALGIADVILMQQYSIFTPISPGRAVGRLYRNSASHREDKAEAFTLVAQDCKELGIIDEIVPEPLEGAQANVEEAAQQLKWAISKQLNGLAKISTKKLMKNRYKKFRNMGEYTSYSEAAVRREVSLLLHIVLKRPRQRKGKDRTKEGVAEV